MKKFSPFQISALTYHWSVFVVIAVLFLANPFLSQAAQIDPETYYKGKSIEFIVPYPAGGGTDLMGRFLSGWLPRFIPGNPSINVVTMPGAGGTIGANHVYKVARKDGTTMMLGSGGNNLSGLLQMKGVEFDMAKMPMVLASSTSIVHYTKGGLLKNFKEAFEKEIIIYGHMPPGGSQTTTFLLAKEVLGMKTKKLVLAYGGSGDARRAFLSGEVNATSDTHIGYMGQLRAMEKKGEISMLWQTGTLDPDGNIVKVDPPMGHIPTVYDRYVEIYGKDPSGQVWEAFKIVVGAVIVFDKSISFPPGTPREVVDILSKACEKMIKDPKFIAEDNAKLKLNPMAGAKMQKIFDKFFVNADPEGKKWLKSWMKEKWGVD